MVSPESVPQPQDGETRQDVLVYIGVHVDTPTLLTSKERHAFELICKWTNSLPGERILPLRIPLWRFAQVMGCSDRTVGQILKKLATLQVIQREYETFRDDDGLITHSEVRVAPYRDPFATESYPEPKPESPPPVRCCGACGSEHVYAAHIARFRCRDCGNIDEVTLGPVPGLANPAGPVLVRSFPEPPPFPLHLVPEPPPSEKEPAPFDGVGVPVESVVHVPPKPLEPLPEPRLSWIAEPWPATRARPWWSCDCGAWAWETCDLEYWLCSKCRATAMAEGLPP